MNKYIVIGFLFSIKMLLADCPTLNNADDAKELVNLVEQEGKKFIISNEPRYRFTNKDTHYYISENNYEELKYFGPNIAHIKFRNETLEKQRVRCNYTIYYSDYEPVNFYISRSSSKKPLGEN